jgi:hypothetical protein
MNYLPGDDSIVENLNLDQLKAYWHELKMSRYDSHFYLILVEKLKSLNPNLVYPADEEIQRIRQEAINLALWEENWEIKNHERVKNGGVDYSLFGKKDNIRKLSDAPGNNMTVNG